MLAHPLKTGVLVATHKVPLLNVPFESIGKLDSGGNRADEEGVGCGLHAAVFLMKQPGCLVTRH